MGWGLHGPRFLSAESKGGAYPPKQWGADHAESIRRGRMVGYRRGNDNARTASCKDSTSPDPNQIMAAVSSDGAVPPRTPSRSSVTAVVSAVLQDFDPTLPSPSASQLQAAVEWQFDDDEHDEEGEAALEDFLIADSSVADPPTVRTLRVLSPAAPNRPTPPPAAPTAVILASKREAALKKRIEKLEGVAKESKLELEKTCNHVRVLEKDNADLKILLAASNKKGGLNFQEAASLRKSLKHVESLHEEKVSKLEADVACLKRENVTMRTRLRSKVCGLPGHNECRTGDWSPILSKQTECPVPKVWRQLSAQSHPVPDISRGLSAQSQSPSGDSVPSPASPERCARTPALAVRAGERYQENTVQLLKHLNRANTQGGEQTKNKHSGSEQTVGWWCW